MTIASAFAPERFDVLARQLTARVNAVAPAATLELAHDDNGYCCALTTHRTALEALGVSCTFTPGSATRDDTVFTWSDRDLTDWLVGTCDNRDLVWRWDFRKGAPAEQQFEDVLVALLPVWVAWNSL